MPENLWPEVFEAISTKTPLAILREQAALLGQRTANIVVGRVHSVGAGSGKFRHIFNLYCASLAYQTELLWVENDLNLYPAEIFLDDHNNPVRADTPETFSARLKVIFAREETKKMITSLIAQSM